MSPPRSGWSTLIIRVWVTDAGGLRARLTELDDVESPGRPVAVAGAVEDVLGETRAWLERVITS